MIVTTTTVIPVQYRVTSIEAIVPLSMTYGFHLLWPFVLDSDITTFTVSRVGSGRVVGSRPCIGWHAEL
jgi:hypothetical protein